MRAAGTQAALMTPRFTSAGTSVEIFFMSLLKRPITRGRRLNTFVDFFNHVQLMNYITHQPLHIPILVGFTHFEPVFKVQCCALALCCVYVNGHALLCWYCHKQPRPGRSLCFPSLWTGAVKKILHSHPRLRISPGFVTDLSVCVNSTQTHQALRCYLCDCFHRLITSVFVVYGHVCVFTQ